MGAAQWNPRSGILRLIKLLTKRQMTLSSRMYYEKPSTPCAVINPMTSHNTRNTMYFVSNQANPDLPSHSRVRFILGHPAALGHYSPACSPVSVLQKNWNRYPIQYGLAVSVEAFDTGGSDLCGTVRVEGRRNTAYCRSLWILSLGWVGEIQPPCVGEPSCRHGERWTKYDRRSV